MTDLKISTRLALGNALLIALIVFLAIFGLMRVKSTNASTKTIYEDRVVALKQLKTVSDGYASSIVDSTNKAAAGLLDSKKAAAQIDAANAENAAQWKAYTATFLTDEEKQGVGVTTDLMAKAQPVIASAKAALESSEQEKITAAIKPLYEAIDPLTESLGKLVDIQLSESKAEYDRAAKAYDSTVAIFSVLVVFAIAAGSAIAWLLIRAITVPLNTAVAVARAVAGGDLTQRIDASGKSETALLLAALNDMQAGLVKVVTSVR